MSFFAFKVAIQKMKKDKTLRFIVYHDYLKNNCKI